MAETRFRRSKNRAGGDIDVAHWRKLNVITLCKDNMEFVASKCNTSAEDDELHLVYENIEIQLLHEFMKFVSNASLSTLGHANGKSTGLDAFITTPLTCLRSDETDRAYGHRQNLYHDTFIAFMLLAYSELVCVARIIVETWCQADFFVEEISVYADDASKKLFTEQEETVEVFITTMGRRIPAIS